MEQTIDPDLIQHLTAKTAHKHMKREIVFNDEITFKIPKRGIPVSLFRIYKEKIDFKHLIGEIPNSGQKKMKFIVSDINPCKNRKYYIVAVSSFGNTSKPAKGSIKKNLSKCLIYKKEDN